MTHQDEFSDCKVSFERAIDILPNGLHDAELVTLNVDYARAEVTLCVNADISSPEDPPGSLAPRYRRARLRFRGLQFIVIDPPHHPDCDGLKGLSTIAAGEGQPDRAPVVLPPLMPGAFLCWIYVGHQNAFIRIAARSVSVEWIDET